MCRVNPIYPVAKVKSNLHQKHSEEFQNILENNLDIDQDHVFDEGTNEVIEDLDSLSSSTLKNLLREE